MDASFLTINNFGRIRKKVATLFLKDIVSFSSFALFCIRKLNSMQITYNMFSENIPMSIVFSKFTGTTFHNTS